MLWRRRGVGGRRVRRRRGASATTAARGARAGGAGGARVSRGGRGRARAERAVGRPRRARLHHVRRPALHPGLPQPDRHTHQGTARHAAQR